MTESWAFICAIQDDPDDDNARMAYIDWLEENDHPVTAEYHRLTLEHRRLRRVPCSVAAGTWVDTLVRPAGETVSEWPNSPPARCHMSYREPSDTGLCRKCTRIDEIIRAIIAVEKRL